MRHLLADQPGVFPLGSEWITNDRVSKIGCQLTAALVMDRLRAKVAAKALPHLSPLEFLDVLGQDRLWASVASTTVLY